MSTRVSFMLVFSAGIAFLGFAQIYLFRKIYRLIQKSSFRPRAQRVLGAIAALFFALMYLPYPLRLIYKWPEHEVSTLVLYGILYPFSLWGLGSVCSFLIVCVKDVSTSALWSLN